MGISLQACKRLFKEHFRVSCSCRFLDSFRILCPLLWTILLAGLYYQTNNVITIFHLIAHENKWKTADLAFEVHRIFKNWWKIAYKYTDFRALQIPNLLVSTIGSITNSWNAYANVIICHQWCPSEQRITHNDDIGAHISLRWRSSALSGDWSHPAADEQSFSCLQEAINDWVVRLDIFRL